ncbi:MULTISPECIES: hypothetical protein [Stutzerimonas stutzeri group]|uniref:Uncharacterized protein n=1 Tax=Stutzerimonas degradans TaxID=2968968 RepID=A0A8E2U2M3_9GAMM|nr:MULTISPECIES: hypothetical protein [Stutzerimonas stutzeri group]MCQ4274491.1 hypothetical protein [Stutzerimonas degradans]PNF77922.1 hypothetical protein CXK95_01105 [Stutzerimonas degradans]QPT23317.1 hypothetical protein I6G33_08715 [Stutzerimonas degradans]
MYFKILPLRDHGKPRDKQQLKSISPAQGDLRIEHQPCNELGRPARVAFLCCPQPNDTPLGKLLDVELHSMAPNGFIVTGVELIDGVAYGQSWLCRES